LVDEATIARVPTLLLWGAVDTWVPPRVAERTRERVPAFQLAMLAGAGHSPMETHIAEMWEVLEPWLASVAARTERADAGPAASDGKVGSGNEARSAHTPPG
jgi:alpha-beta hydrolase superfamily lysophospholipase